MYNNCAFYEQKNIIQKRQYIIKLVLEKEIGTLPLGR